MTDNPQNPCGVYPECCPGEFIPDNLVAEVETECGAESWPLRLGTVVEPGAFYEWNGGGKYSCKPPGQGCMDFSGAISVVCNGTSWLLAQSPCSQNLNIKCDKFEMTSDCTSVSPCMAANMKITIKAG